MLCQSLKISYNFIRKAKTEARLNVSRALRYNLFVFEL